MQVKRNKGVIVLRPRIVIPDNIKFLGFAVRFKIKNQKDYQITPEGKIYSMKFKNGDHLYGLYLPDDTKEIHDQNEGIVIVEDLDLINDFVAVELSWNLIQNGKNFKVSYVYNLEMNLSESKNLFEIISTFNWLPNSTIQTECFGVDEQKFRWVENHEGKVLEEGIYVQTDHPLVVNGIYTN